MSKCEAGERGCPWAACSHHSRTWELDIPCWLLVIQVLGCLLCSTISMMLWQAFSLRDFGGPEPRALPRAKLLRTFSANCFTGNAGVPHAKIARSPGAGIKLALFGFELALFGFATLIFRLKLGLNWVCFYLYFLNESLLF